jgi:catechol 2,3-dioxygenase-like lactoylglutathione lyase family enzyme
MVRVRGREGQRLLLRSAEAVDAGLGGVPGVEPRGGRRWWYDGAMPAPLTLSHLNIPSRDPERLRRFYVEALGLREHGRMLYAGRSVLNIASGDPLPSGSFHFGFWLPGKDDVRGWSDRLRERGVDVEEPYVDHGAYATAYFRDPDGNVLELFWEDEPPHVAPDTSR